MHGKARPSSSYVLTQWLFLRALGLVYVIAFSSLSTQILGLIGAGGILPAKEYLADLSGALSLMPGGPMLTLPTLVWFNSSDWFLQFLCLGGILSGIGIVMSKAKTTVPLLIVSWLFYLSLVNVGQDFLSFQWDSLLLEVGFLAIFWYPRAANSTNPAPFSFKLVLFLLRWLLFRLMFSSGAVKLLSGDLAWRSLTALNFHYFTQPLPTPLAWLAALLPDWFQSVSVGLVLFVELVVPITFFMPYRIRYIGAALTALLQSFILLTGNYTFFNILTLTLCIVLLDDSALLRLLPKQLKAQLLPDSTCNSVRPDLERRDPGAAAVAQQGASEPTCDTERSHAAKKAASLVHVRLLILIQRLAVGLAAAFVIVASTAEMLGSLLGVEVPVVGHMALSLAGSFRIVNGYGLFAVMTTTRPEISVEGSNDGHLWLPYIFKYKPGPLDRPPPIIAPFQPRLDWQMWFAALGPVGQSPWFIQFAHGLLVGSPEILHLLECDPFGGHAPKFIRAVLYDYKFTDFDELRKTGHWWKRTETGIFLPPITLADFKGR